MAPKKHERMRIFEIISYSSVKKCTLWIWLMITSVQCYQLKLSQYVIGYLSVSIWINHVLRIIFHIYTCTKLDHLELKNLAKWQSSIWRNLYPLFGYFENFDLATLQLSSPLHIHCRIGLTPGRIFSTKHAWRNWQGRGARNPKVESLIPAVTIL